MNTKGRLQRLEDEVRELRTEVFSQLDSIIELKEKVRKLGERTDTNVKADHVEFEKGKLYRDERKGLLVLCIDTNNDSRHHLRGVVVEAPKPTIYEVGDVVDIYNANSKPFAHNYSFSFPGPEPKDQPEPAKLQWYATPQYRNEGWKILNEKGELVATFEDKTECEKTVFLFNDYLRLSKK